MAENNYEYEVSDFFENYVFDPPPGVGVSAGYDDVVHPTHDSGNQTSSLDGGVAMINNSTNEFIGDGSVNGKKERGEKFAFKTKSQVEVLDDGFKWRKYGKKMVKNSPNPRNYYRCSVDGCPVKKQVERDKEDPQYVLTTYEGVHIHHS